MTLTEEGPIRIRNEAQQLIGAGYQWLETRQIVMVAYYALLALWLMLLMYFFFGDPWHYFFDQRLNVLVAVLLGGALAAGPSLLILLAMRMFPAVTNKLSLRPRALIFYSSGDIFAPYGRPYRWYFAGTKPLYYRMAMPMTSIQSSQAGRMFPVNIYFSNGERLLVSVTSDWDESRTLAVELTRAHEELKAAHRRPSDTSQVVIN